MSLFPVGFPLMSYLLPLDILGNPGKDNFIAGFEVVPVGISISRHGRFPEIRSSKYSYVSL
jgi:hypothetical protein